jgi:hypothetical protein
VGDGAGGVGGSEGDSTGSVAMPACGLRSKSRIKISSKSQGKEVEGL